MQQGSPEWIEARLGKATGSRVADIVAEIKTGWGKSREDYLNELVFERINSVPVPQYQSVDMLNGTMREAEARARYAFEMDTEVTEVGFIPHPTMEMAGCSPDGLVSEDGTIEIKCPKWSTHQETLRTKTIPARYLKQIQFGLAVTGRLWCDYISYSPQWREDLRIEIIRVPRDDKMIDYLETQVRAFLVEVNRETAALCDRIGKRRAA